MEGWHSWDFDRGCGALGLILCVSCTSFGISGSCMKNCRNETIFKVSNHISYDFNCSESLLLIGCSIWWSLLLPFDDLCCFWSAFYYVVFGIWALWVYINVIGSFWHLFGICHLLFCSCFILVIRSLNPWLMSQLAFGTPNHLGFAWPWRGIQSSGECWKCRVYLWHLWNILSQFRFCFIDRQMSYCGSYNDLCSVLLSLTASPLCSFVNVSNF